MSNDKKLNWFEKQPQLTKKIIEERVKEWCKSCELPLSPYDLKFARDELKNPYSREGLIKYLKIMYNHAIGCSCLYRMSLEQLEAAVVNIYDTYTVECEKERKILNNPPKSGSNVVCGSMKKQSEEIDMKLANSKLDKKNQKEEPEYLKGLTKEIILKRFGDKGMYTKNNLLIELYKNLTPNMLKTYRKNSDISIIMSYNLVSYIKTAIGRGHSILKGISKEKAWDVAIEIAEIVHKEKSNFDKKEEHKCSCGGNCSCHNKQKAKLTLADGREIEVEISEEELKKIEIKKSPYAFSDWHETMYFVNDSGFTTDILPNSCSDGYITGLIENENFYNSEDFAEKCARADLLMRKLRKFAIESNLNKETMIYRYSILRGPSGKFKFVPTVIHKDNQYSDFGTILFKDVEDCKKAIETFHDELTWYFTEYLKIYE